MLVSRDVNLILNICQNRNIAGLELAGYEHLDFHDSFFYVYLSLRSNTC